MKRHAWSFFVGALGLALGCSDKPCPAGSESCACSADSTCNDGLVCASNVCVDPASLSPTGGASSSSGSTSTGAVGTTGAGGSATSATANSASGNSTSGSGAAAGNAGTTGTGGSAAGGNAGTDLPLGEPCTNLGEGSGNCSEGDARVCRGEVWQAEDCTACALLSHPSYCGAFSAFALNYIGPPDYYEDFPQGVAQLTQTEIYVQADFVFDLPDGIGAIQLRLSSPLALGSGDVSIRGLDATGSGGLVDVTFEALDENGVSVAGCEYSLYPTGAINVALFGLDDSCWGGFTEGSPATVINVRLHPSAAASSSLRFSGIDLVP